MPARRGVSLREADVAGDRGCGRARQGLHRPLRAVEQHGPHLPLDVDILCPTGSRLEPVAKIPDQGARAADGRVRLHGPRHGLPGHDQQPLRAFMPTCSTSRSRSPTTGSRRSSCSTATGPTSRTWISSPAARTSRPTPSACRAVDEPPHDRQGFLPSWRESAFPGGCSHACELETSVYMTSTRTTSAGPDRERHDLYNEAKNPSTRLLRRPGRPGLSWTSSYRRPACSVSPSSRPWKGRSVPTRNIPPLIAFVDYFRARPRMRRRPASNRAKMPMPWGQTPASRSRRHEARRRPLIGTTRQPTDPIGGCRAREPRVRFARDVLRARLPPAYRCRGGAPVRSADVTLTAADGTVRCCVFGIPLRCCPWWRRLASRRGGASRPTQEVALRFAE